MKNIKKTGVVAMILVAAIALMGFGFAAWTTELTAEGTVAADASWEIVFTDVTVKGSSAAEVGATAAAVINDGASIDFGDVTFTQPLGWIEYQVTVANNGSVDAELTTAAVALADNAEGFTAKIADDLAGETLAAEGTCVFTVLIQADDVTGEEEFVATGNFNLELNYEAISTVDEATGPSHTAH